MTIAIPAAPTPPSRRSPFLFAQRTDDLLAWMPGGVAAMNAQNAENNALASAAAGSAQTAAGHVVTAAAHAAAASTSATAAAALANFKGAWSALSGALNTPASVLHLGQMWMLLNNLANVASAEPGISSANWFAVVTPQRPLIKPCISVDWTLKPTAAALTAAGWTISRASEMTYFGAAPVKVAENLLIESRSFGAAWDKTSAPVTMNPVTHASGLTGFSLAATAASGLHGLKRNLTEGMYLPNQLHRLRFLVKAGAYTKVQVGDYWQGRAAARFDLAAGAIIASSGGTGYVSHSITPNELGGGLYWCELVMTSSATGGWTPAVMGYPDSGSTLTSGGVSYTGDGTSGIEVYAAQLQHNFDGDWVETTTTPVTLYASPLLTAAANELAYQHNVNGECLGLLSYPAATNLCLQSQNLEHASWGGTGIVTTATKRLWAAAAPFDRVTRTDSVASRALSQRCFTPAAGNTFTLTIALMGDYWSGTTSVDVALSGDVNGFGGLTADSNFVILSGPGTVARQGTGAMVRVTGLSYTVPTVILITRTYPLAESVAQGVFIYPDTSASTTPGKAILATRVQIESGPRATPYIPTTAAAVTRAAQSVSLTGSAFTAAANPAQGTLLARASVEQSIWDGTRFAVQLDHSAAPTAFQTGLASDSTTSTLRATTRNQNTDQAAITTLTNAWSTTPSTAAYSYQLNNFQAAVNGTLSAADTSGVVPAVNRLLPGGVSGSAGWAGLIQRTELYPRAMTAAELAAITTPRVPV